jgi:uncharacterized protein (DUF1800 family)
MRKGADVNVAAPKGSTVDEGPKTAALALHRFGFGPRAGAIAAIASDPRGALLASLTGWTPVRSRRRTF